MLIPKDLQEINLEVARTLGVSKFLVKDVVKHFYGELREHITNPEFKSILVHNLGTFKVNQGSLKHLLRKGVSIRGNEEKYNQFTELLNEKDKDEFKMEQSKDIDGEQIS